MRRIITLLLLIGLQIAAFSQVTPSVYVGMGTGTNLGGGVGIGTEIKYKFISFNTAVGCFKVKPPQQTRRPPTWFNIFPGYYIDNSPQQTKEQLRFGFDVGFKVYPIKGWFLGVNYGIMSKPRIITDSSGFKRLQEVEGFSFTTGYRWRFYKGLYGMAYLGLTDRKDINRPLFFGKPFLTLLRAGLIVGWDFLPHKKDQP